jgi:hypothetical protein
MISLTYALPPPRKSQTIFSGPLARGMAYLIILPLSLAGWICPKYRQKATVLKSHRPRLHSLARDCKWLIRHLGSTGPGRAWTQKSGDHLAAEHYWTEDCHVVRPEHSWISMDPGFSSEALRQCPSPRSGKITHPSIPPTMTRVGGAPMGPSLG